MAPTHERLLEIYLADHFAAATAGVELARRAYRNNAATEFGEALSRLSADVEDDRRTLQRIISELGFRESKVKQGAAWFGEKLGRLKLNGQVRGYSPLSRVLELEALSVGIAGKLALWQSLQSVPDIDRRLPGTDLEQLVERAQRQRATVEEQRLSAARAAFAPVEAGRLT